MVPKEDARLMKLLTGELSHVGRENCKNSKDLIINLPKQTSLISNYIENHSVNEHAKNAMK